MAQTLSQNQLNSERYRQDQFSVNTESQKYGTLTLNVTGGAPRGVGAFDCFARLRYDDSEFNS
jgi:hypothetical protein